MAKTRKIEKKKKKKLLELKNLPFRWVAKYFRDRKQKK